MPAVSAVHIVFDPANDPQGFAKRHVGRQMASGKKQSEIVADAWLHRHDPVPNAVTSTAFRRARTDVRVSLHRCRTELN